MRTCRRSNNLDDYYLKILNLILNDNQIMQNEGNDEEYFFFQTILIMLTKIKIMKKQKILKN